MSKFSITFLALILLGASLFAQGETETEALFLKKNTSLNISMVGGLLEITEHNFSEKVFYRNFEKHSHESVYYSDFDPVTNLEAMTLIPNGSSYKKMKVSTIETKDIVQPGIFYGGYKRRDFVFPMLTAGAIGRLEYSKRITDVHLLSPFYFNEDIGVQSAEFSVTCPRTVSLRYKLFGEQTDNIKFKEVVSGHHITYSWTLTDVHAYKKEKNSPSRSYTAPHIIVYVDSYESKGNKQRVLSDVSDLYRWYDDLVKRIPPTQDNTVLREAVTTITKNATTDVEKIKSIFQWVQHNIKYVAFENGMAGFVPRSSADVYTKRYGDCKDMANILKDMLKLSGVEAYHTWIGTRSKPYTYLDVPTAVADNHMICSVKTLEGYVFLDATNPFLSYGSPSSMIQGKEALIGVTRDKYEIVVVPIVNRSNNYRYDSLIVKLEKDGVRGTFSSRLTGYRKDDIETDHLKAELNSNRENIRDFFTIGGNNIAIENLAVKGLGDQNAAASIRFNFFQPGYYKSIGDKIYVNLNLNKTLPGDKLEASIRKQSLEQDYCYEDRSVLVFEIPEGYTASFIPKNITKTWPEFGVTSTYRESGNTLILEKVLYSDYLYLNTGKFQQWNEFLEVLNTIHQQSITLTKDK